METNEKIKINGTEIDLSQRYEGYLWLSDAKHPIVFYKDEPMKEHEVFKKQNPFLTKNPFIIEGQLFCKDTGVSYSIKYVDGEYMVGECCVKDDEIRQRVKSFVANRIPRIKNIRFVECWKSDRDDLCEYMEVLMPAGMVFVGFEE